MKKDILWKSIMEDLFIDFMRFIHPGVDEILDLEKHSFIDKELEPITVPANGQYSSIQVDKLVKVLSREGKEELILLHFEFQDQYSQDFGKRMFKYYYHLVDKHKDKRISAYAIFTDATKILRPDVYSSSFMGTTLDYKFNTYKINGPSDEELLASENPFAIVVRAARTIFKGRNIKDPLQRDSLLKDLKIALIKELYASKLKVEKRKHIHDFISEYISFEMIEIKDIFDKELLIFQKTNKNMGIREAILLMKKEEGIEIGKMEGKKEGKIEGKKEGKIEGKREGKREGKKEGKKEGKIEGKIEAEKQHENKLRKLAHNFIHSYNYTEERTAELLDVPLEFVRNCG